MATTLEPLSVTGFEVGDIVECIAGASRTQVGRQYRVIPSGKAEYLNLEALEGAPLLISPFGSRGYGIPSSELGRFAVVEKATQRRVTLEPPESGDEFEVGDIIECLNTQGNVLAGTRYRVVPGDLALNFVNLDGTFLKSGIKGTSNWGDFAIVQKARLRTPIAASDFQVGDIVKCISSGRYTTSGVLYKVIPSGKDKVNLTQLDGTSIQTFRPNEGTETWQRFVIVENGPIQGGNTMPVTADVRQIAESLAEERRSVRRITEKGEEQLGIALTRIESLEKRLTPDSLRGVIRNYRYGMNNDELNAPGKGDKALTISFDLEVGQQVWLHTVLGLREWETFISSQTDALTGAEDEIGTTKFWNGKRLMVRRNADIDRFVPIRFYSGEKLGFDCNEREVFAGDRVQLLDESEDTAEVRNYDVAANRYNVRRDVFTEGVGPFDEGYGGSGGKLWQVSPSQVELLPE